jgi:hypothetical protein
MATDIGQTMPLTIGLRGYTVVLTTPYGACDIYLDAAKAIRVSNWGTVHPGREAEVSALLTNWWVRQEYFEIAEIARRSSAEYEAEQLRKAEREALAAAEADYGVVDMDGTLVTDCPMTRDAATDLAERESREYATSRPDGDRSYLPRSVVRLSTGWRRAWQYSTRWI